MVLIKTSNIMYFRRKIEKIAQILIEFEEAQKVVLAKTRRWIGWYQRRQSLRMKKQLSAGCILADAKPEAGRLKEKQTKKLLKQSWSFTKQEVR